MVETVEAEPARARRPELSPQAEVAVLARALYAEGYNDHDTGHITYRQPDGTYLALPLELGWNEVRASDIIRIDGEGRLLEGRWSVPPPIRLHLEFHRARPGCDVTIHQHPHYATIWAALGRVPAVYDQLSAALSDADIVYYDDYTGLVSDAEAARAAVRAVGNAKCALLRNHGVFVVGESIEQAFSSAVALEWRCRQAWLVEAIPGERRTVPDYGRRAIEDSIRADGIVPGMWPWAVRRQFGRPEPVLS
jgi:ribulose-5-phosphate 4-epimerase/fuculose-1-phosphate aldolase